MNSSHHKKPVILALIDYYVPGFKAGGPLRTLSNMVEQLSTDFNFRILTRDRDFGDPAPFANIPSGQWTKQNHAQVFYVPQSKWDIFQIRKLLLDTPHDALYLNSFFSPKMTGWPLLLRRLGQLRPVPTVLAPRGEFSPGAIGINYHRKRAYMALAKQLGLYRRVIWHASSVEEVGDIRSQFPILLRADESRSAAVITAPNLVSRSVFQSANSAGSRPPGALRLVFLSRISPKKNLDFLLRVLGQVRSPIELAIYGPIDDSSYWSECESLMAALPPHVKVSLGGHVPNELVGSIFSKNDLFAFPTRGENFGHAIFEALAAGTPVLVSDKTPWAADSVGAVQVLPLSEKLWIAAIEHWCSYNEPQFLARRQAAIERAQKYVGNEAPLKKNRSLFATAIDMSPRDSGKHDE